MTPIAERPPENGVDGRYRRQGRDSVRDAALTLFSDYGYQKTTMNDIANALGIRAPSLYNHLSSKEELFEEIMFDSMNDMVSSYLEATKGLTDPVERLRVGFECHLRYHIRQRREAFVINREMRSLSPATRARVLTLRDDYERSFRSTIEDGVKAGVFVVESPKLASFALMAMGRGLATWFRDDGDLSEDDIVRQFVQYGLRTVGAVDAGGEAPAPTRKPRKRST